MSGFDKYVEVPTDTGFEHGPLTQEEYQWHEHQLECYLKGALDDDGSNGMSERDIDIMVHGYDRDDWRACAARDYEHEALRSIERDGGRVIW